MTPTSNSIIEDAALRSSPGENQIRILWDGILDILLERVHHKSISNVELAHLIDELNLLLRAVKGSNGVWGSVVDVALFVVKRDVTIRDLRTNMEYNESTIYRALGRLEMAGVIVRTKGQGMAGLWTINRETCPVLYRASRSRSQ